MLKLEHTEVVGWEAAIRGMRNPLESWERSDTVYGTYWGDIDGHKCIDHEGFSLGNNDHDLMMRLAKGGPVHAKYRRMIAVYVDITAPLYWWKEFDTYKVGTVANSCSTIHKIAAKEFTLEDFSCEHLSNFSSHPEKVLDPLSILKSTIVTLNSCRHEYLETKDKFFWWQMIQLLPSSYNQKRTVMLNYEVLAGIYPMRKNHKLDEWREFCDWIETLPYSEIITGMSESEKMLWIGEKLHEGFEKGLKTVREIPSFDIDNFMKEAKAITLTPGMKITETSGSIEHLVDVTCSWDDPDFIGYRLYEIGPGFTDEDLTPYEKRLLERSNKLREWIKNRNKE